jgi:hypothetical protein
MYRDVVFNRSATSAKGWIIEISETFDLVSFLKLKKKQKQIDRMGKVMYKLNLSTDRPRRNKSDS